MSESHDPPRLLEAPEFALAELEPLLREARTQGPSAEQAARMRAALGLPAAADPTQAADASKRTRAEGGAPTPNWLKLSLLVALGIGAVFLVRRALPSVQPDVERSARTAPSGVGLQPSAPSPVPDPQLSPPALAVPPAEPAHVAEPVRAAAPARRGRSAVPVRAVEEPSAQSVGAGDPAAELALLKRAKAHARSAPERALALLAEHEQRFANGAFVQEREVIAIEALLASGDRAAAERRAARFLERFADSAHARRVRALLGAPSAVLSDTNSGVASHPTR